MTSAVIAFEVEKTREWGVRGDRHLLGIRRVIRPVAPGVADLARSSTTTPLRRTQSWSAGWTPARYSSRAEAQIRPTVRPVETSRLRSGLLADVGGRVEVFREAGFAAAGRGRTADGGSSAAAASAHCMAPRRVRSTGSLTTLGHSLSSRVGEGAGRPAARRSRDGQPPREQPATMCGIVGYVGPRQARPLLLAGLEKLEYRGYDSAGISVLDGDRIDAVRAVGNLSALRAALDGRDGGRRSRRDPRWRSPSRRRRRTGHRPHALGHPRPRRPRRTPTRTSTPPTGSTSSSTGSSRTTSR